MAKERMVTRTINSTTITVKCYDRQAKVFEDITKTFTGKFNTEDEYEIFAHFDTSKYRAVEVVDCKVNQCKYALPERLFIQYGKIITEDEAKDYEED